MTPLTKVDQVFFKREDQNVTGSAKDRSLIVQIDNLLKLGYTSACISSTGNAAISADYYCHLHNILLTVFVSPNINQSKLKLIKHAKIISTINPISQSFKYSKNNQSYFLRQSTDPTALIGYQQIGEEIIQQNPQTDAIFVPTGSGTTLIGVALNIPTNIKIFAVQPASHCPISSKFDKNFLPETINITDSITVKLLPLKSQIISLLSQRGGGIVVNNDAIMSAHDYLTNHQITTSFEGSMAYAGFRKIQSQYNFKNPVIVITGTSR